MRYASIAALLSAGLFVHSAAAQEINFPGPSVLENPSVTDEAGFAPRIIATSPAFNAGPYAPAPRRIERRQGGVFSNLLELERRKNQWLRRTFLGR